MSEILANWRNYFRRLHIFFKGKWIQLFKRCFFKFTISQISREYNFRQLGKNKKKYSDDNLIRENEWKVNSWIFLGAKISDIKNTTIKYSMVHFIYIISEERRFFLILELWYKFRASKFLKWKIFLLSPNGQNRQKKKKIGTSASLLIRDSGGWA